MENESTLIQRFEDVKQRVARAAARIGKRADDVILVAVTKNAHPEQIRTLLERGHRDFGENRVQQLAQRAAVVREWFDRLRVLERTRESGDGKQAGRILTSGTPTGDGTLHGPARWHLIGHLQRNKVRKALEHTRLIHSVDSLRLAEEIQTCADRRELPVDVLVQVNCAGEDKKFGCPVPAAIPLVEQLSTMVNVRVRGLMTIAPYSENPEDSRPVFARCADLFSEVRRAGISDSRFNLLSMGMSGDFEVAIEEGANIVRVGTSIFGEQEYEHPEADDNAELSEEEAST